jgi:hypothetical protein
MMKNKSKNFLPSKWVLFAAVSVFSLIFFLIQLNSRWLYLNAADDFGDLQWVLKRNGCFSKFGFLVYGNGTNTADCNGYIYGSSLLRAMDLFGIDSRIINILGLFFMFIFVGMVSTFILYGKNLRQYLKRTILLLIYILSPVAVLLVQRANIDIAIFALIGCAGYLAAKNKSFYSILLIAIASLMKFYSLPIMLLIIYLEKNSKLQKIYFLILILVTSVIFVDLRYLESIPWDARNMFGNPVWGEYLEYLINGAGHHQNAFVSQVIGFFITVSAILLLLILNNRVELLPVVTNSNRTTVYLFLFYFVSILSCYFSGLSVDYRLVFLFSSYCIFTALHTEKNKTIQVGLSILVVSTFYLSFNVSNLQILGDLAILVVISYMLATMINNGKAIYFKS